MPIRCPHCDRYNTFRLDGLSDGTRIDYFRCDDCCHVWTLPKGDVGAAPSHARARPLKADLRSGKVVPISRRRERE
jgi:transposase-like protein